MHEMTLNQLRALCREFSLRFVRTHPEYNDITADGWIEAIQAITQISSTAEQLSLCEGHPVVEMYNHPDFQRVMVELEDERIFQDPEMN